MTDASRLPIPIEDVNQVVAVYRAVVDEDNGTAPDFKGPPMIFKSGVRNESVQEMADAIFEAVKQYVEKRFAKGNDELAELMRRLETALDPPGGNVRQRVERHAQHLQRLENRIQALERKP